MSRQGRPDNDASGKGDYLHLSDDEWRKRLTPEQFEVLRRKGTEAPGSGKYYHLEEEGVYLCAACGQELFTSGEKYHSGSGWPSFWQPIAPEAVGEQTDGSHFMRRVEVVCSRCGSHLGHVFEDGPRPTGLRYCINSVSLEFKRKPEGKQG